MRRTILISCFVILLAVANAAGRGVDETPVEVTEVREVGISDVDETKSVIEIRWRANPAMTARIRSFRLFLTVVYADGSTFVVTASADPETQRMRIEVPSAKVSRNRPPAFFKNMRAVVLAIFPAQRKTTD